MQRKLHVLLERLAARYKLPAWRIVLVHLGLVVLVGGMGFDTVVGREHWPFSHYPMYSRIELDRSTTSLQLYGIPADGSSTEFALLERQYIQPFDKTRLRSALRRMQAQPNGDGRLRVALQDVLTRYEVLRRAGRHDGPPLRGIRAYELEWQLDPWAANRSRPDRRDLLLEVMAGERS